MKTRCRWLVSLSCSIALCGSLTGSEIADALPPEIEQAVVDIAALPNPYSVDPARETAVWDRKFAAVVNASRLGTNFWPGAGAMITLTAHSNIQVSLAAATVLASIDLEKHPGWADLQKQMHSLSNAHAGFEYLIRGRDDGMRPFLNPRRAFAVQALGLIGPAAQPAANTLLQLLESTAERDVELWPLAAVALRKMDSGPATFLPLLHRRLLDGTEQIEPRIAAANALAQAGANDSDTIAVLRQALADDYARIRLAAIQAWLAIRQPFPEIRPILGELLRHKLVIVRTGALRVVADVGPLARELAPAIKPLLDDPSPKVREAAAAAHKNIEDRSAAPLR